MAVVLLCAIACVSSDTASAMRPPRVYAAPKAAAIYGEKDRKVRVLTDAQSPFEARERPGQIALAKGQETDPVIGTHSAPSVRRFLSDPQPFVPERSALSEQAEFSMAHGESGTGNDRGQEKLVEALVAPCPVERRHRSVNRLTIVALGFVGLAEILVGPAGPHPRQPQ